MSSNVVVEAMGLSPCALAVDKGPLELSKSGKPSLSYLEKASLDDSSGAFLIPDCFPEAPGSENLVDVLP